MPKSSLTAPKNINAVRLPRLCLWLWILQYWIWSCGLLSYWKNCRSVTLSFGLKLQIKEKIVIAKLGNCRCGSTFLSKVAELLPWSYGIPIVNLKKSFRHPPLLFMFSISRYPQISSPCLWTVSSLPHFKLRFFIISISIVSLLGDETGGYIINITFTVTFGRLERQRKIWATCRKTNTCCEEKSGVVKFSHS